MYCVFWIVKWASDWLLFNAKWAIFQLYHRENNLHLGQMMMRTSILYWTDTLSWVFTLLSLCNNNPHMWSHFDTLSWFWVNQSLFLLLNSVCLMEKQQIQIAQSLVWFDLNSHHYLTHSRLTKTPAMRLNCEVRWWLVRIKIPIKRCWIFFIFMVTWINLNLKFWKKVIANNSLNINKTINPLSPQHGWIPKNNVPVANAC